jgi:predicted ATPase
MPEATKQLLQTVAVIGREVPLRLLCAVCSKPGSLVVRPVDAWLSSANSHICVASGSSAQRTNVD